VLFEENVFRDNVRISLWGWCVRRCILDEYFQYGSAFTEPFDPKNSTCFLLARNPGDYFSFL